MKRCVILSLGLCASWALVGCGWWKSKDETAEHPKPQGPTLVGRIASIPTDKRYVLIQSYGKWTIATGTILTTRGDAPRTANLLVTGEALGQFAAADIQSGTVEVGDAVYSAHTPKPEDPAEIAPHASDLPPNATPPVPELPANE